MKAAKLNGRKTYRDKFYRKIDNVLYKRNEILFSICYIFFVGFISLDEFSDACNLISEHMQSPITHDQLIEICKVMDMNKDGLVDLNEFLETFRLVDQEHRLKSSPAREILDSEDMNENHSPVKLETQSIFMHIGSPDKEQDDYQIQSRQDQPKRRLRRESLGIDKGDCYWEYTRTLAELQNDAYKNVPTENQDEKVHSSLSSYDIQVNDCSQQNSPINGRPNI